MPHTYTNLLYHIVFTTKDRRRSITPEFKPRLYDYMGGVIRGVGGILLEIGGVEDHVHLLVKLKPTLNFPDFMRVLKTNSSAWANKVTNGQFGWQPGYGAFTIGESQIEGVRKYIRNQERHHSKMDFEGEFNDLLKKSGIEFDEKFLWT